MDSGHVIVPQGWQREVTVGEEFVYYISPDKRILRNREELLLHLTSQGTCKCGLRCPFRFDEQFSFDPTVIGLPDNSAYIEETQSLCKISHMYGSETTINVTSARHKLRTNSSPKLHMSKTSPSMAQRFVVSSYPKKQGGVKRLQALRVSQSAKGGRHDVKGSNVKRVENSTGAEAKDVSLVPKSSEALVKVDSSTAEGSPSSRNATLATLLKSSRELSWLTNLCTAKLAEPSQQQGKQESLQVGVLPENTSATGLPALQNVTKSMRAVEEKSMLGDEISEASSAVLQNSPFQGKEELKVSITLGKPSSASEGGSEVIKALMVSIPRGESGPEGPEVVQQAEGSSDPAVDSSPAGVETSLNEVEPKHDEAVSRHAEMESSCGGLNESRSSEETLSASESEFQGVGSESGGFRESDFQKGQHGSDRGSGQCLGEEEADLGEVQTLAASQQGKEDVGQEMLPSASASAGSVAKTEGGSVGSLPSDSLIALPHSPPLTELPVSTTTPSTFSEIDPANLQKNYSATETAHSPSQGSVQQSDSELQMTAALTVASESQSASLGIHPRGVLCASPHVSSLPVPLMGVKRYTGWSSGSHSEKPEVHSLVMNGTHPTSDRVEQVSALSIPSSYVREPVTDQLEEVLLIPLPEVPSSVQADIQASASSQCLTGNSVPCSVTPLDTPHHPTPSIPPVNGVSLPADPCPTNPSVASTHVISPKSPFTPISTIGVPTNADLSQLHSNKVQEVGLLTENAGFFDCNSSPLSIPCANAFLSPKRSPSKDIAMRDFHISIKPLREFNIRKRRSSEMFEADGGRYSPDVGWNPSPKKRRFVGSKVVGDSCEKTVEGSPEQVSASEVHEPTDEKELPTQQESESTKLVAVLPRDLNIADLISMLQDSVPNSGTETSDSILHSQAIGALAAQIVDVAGTQGYVEGASSILVLSHQSPELEAILQAAVTQQMESARLPNTGACVETTTGTATDHLASNGRFELRTSGPSVPDKCNSIPSEKSVNQEEPAMSEVTPEQQAASLFTSAEAVSTMEATVKEIKDVCHSPERHGADNQVRISPGSDHSVVSPMETHLQEDVHPHDQELQPLSPPLDEPEQLLQSTATIPFQDTKKPITPDLKSPVSDSDSVSPETKEMSTQPPATCTDKPCGDIEQSRPCFGESPTAHNHVPADLHVEVQGEKEDNSADVEPDSERDLSCMEVLASSETSNLDGQLSRVGRQTGMQRTPTAQGEVEDVYDRSVNGDGKSSMEVHVAVDVLLQLSRSFTSSSSEVEDSSVLEVKDQTTCGDSGESVALNPCTDHEATVTMVSRVSESEALKKSASKQQKEEVAVKMGEIRVENLAGLTKESEVQISDTVDVDSNVNHNAGRFGTIGTKEIGGLECKETMKNEDFDDATAAEAVAELSEVHISESSHCSPGPSGLQEEKAVKSDHKLATSPKVIMQQRSSSPEVQEEEEEGRLIRVSRSEPPPCSERSRNQLSFSSLDQDVDPLMNSSGSGFSFSSCSDTPGCSTSSGKQSNSPTTSTSTKSPTPIPKSERRPISRGKHKPTPISPPHPKKLIVSIPLDKVSIIHCSILECYPTPVFGVGDIVWAKASLLPGWPGRIISHSKRKKDKLKPPPEGMFWVEWFGDGTISLVEEETVRTLKEGIKNRKMGKKGKKNKIPRQLQEAMREALKAQKKQLKVKKKS